MGFKNRRKVVMAVSSAGISSDAGASLTSAATDGPRRDRGARRERPIRERFGRTLFKATRASACCATWNPEREWASHRVERHAGAEPERAKAFRSVARRSVLRAHCHTEEALYGSRLRFAAGVLGWVESTKAQVRANHQTSRRTRSFSATLRRRRDGPGVGFERQGDLVHLSAHFGDRRPADGNRSQGRSGGNAMLASSLGWTLRPDDGNAGVGGLPYAVPHARCYDREVGHQEHAHAERRAASPHPKTPWPRPTVSRPFATRPTAQQSPIREEVG